MPSFTLINFSRPFDIFFAFLSVCEACEYPYTNRTQINTDFYFSLINIFISVKQTLTFFVGIVRNSECIQILSYFSKAENHCHILYPSYFKEACQEPSNTLNVLTFPDLL